MESRLTSASSFAADDFRPEVEHQLTKWRSDLTSEQIRVVLEVVQAFGLDFYTEDLFPTDRLFQFQSPSMRPSALRKNSTHTS
jgi:hypothetical protein